MICVCGHSENVHKEIHKPFNIGDKIKVICEVCECDRFCENIDRDKLEVIDVSV